MDREYRNEQVLHNIDGQVLVEGAEAEAMLSQVTGGGAPGMLAGSSDVNSSSGVVGVGDAGIVAQKRAEREREAAVRARTSGLTTVPWAWKW